jgi:hypothetical protein
LAIRLTLFLSRTIYNGQLRDIAFNKVIHYNEIWRVNIYIGIS